MKTRFNKLTAWLLTLAMLMTLVPGMTFTAFAADSFVASVTTADGQTTTYHTDINEAIDTAKQNSGSTLTLLDAIDTNGTVTIDSGSFTIDLGGNTWTFSSGDLNISGDAYITITDSTDGAGKLSVTAYYTINLIDSATLEITGGTVENTGGTYGVNMSDSGVTTNAQLTVSGGKVSTTGSNAIHAAGSLVKVTGGTIESNASNIYYYNGNGVIDLSEHEAPAGITIYNDIGAAVTPGENTIKLPDGYVMQDNYGNVAESLEVGKTYSVGEDPGPVASVTMADGQTTTYHTDINAAINAAKQNSDSTLKLLDAIDMDTFVYISGGSFTIDLNGKTWQSSKNVLLFDGTDIKITITDSSADGTGRLLGTSESSTIDLPQGNTVLEISGGTVENTGGNEAVDMSDAGTKSNAQLIMSGGALITTGNNAIGASGSLVKVTGGTIKSNGYDIYYHNGVIDLSGHEGPAGIKILNATGAAVTPGKDTIMLPNGYVMLGSDGNAVDSLADGGIYTVGVAGAYTVTVNGSANGTVTADKTTAAEGDIITLTVKPAEGYLLDLLTVTGASGAVETIAGEDNTYTFTMPASTVTVTATFWAVTAPAGSIASVAPADGRTSYHTDINAAINAAKQNRGSTLKLLDNISRGDEVTINSGSFTIDLNGKTWYSSGDVMLIEGTDTNITITDSMQGGTLEAGGTHAIEMKGGSVKINGGTIPVKIDNGWTSGGWIGYYTGAGELDLSGHNDPAGIIFYSTVTVEVPEKPNIKLPAGYILYDTFNKKFVTEPEWWDEYEVKKCEHNTIEDDKCTVCGTVLGNKIVKYDEAAKSATVTVKEAGTYTLIFAKYGEGNRLDKVDVVEFPFTKGENTIPQEIKDFTLGAGDKIMLWQNMTTLVPLCEAYIVK